jgi:hypothetical protein
MLKVEGMETLLAPDFQVRWQSLSSLTFPPPKAERPIGIKFALS